MPWRPRSRPEAWARLREAGVPEWVLGHVACVEALAVAFAQRAVEAGHTVDVELVRYGAILHDVGRGVTQDPTHAFIGAARLREDNCDEALVRIVERHTGAGLTASDAKALGLPEAPLVPETLEEQIVAHADNLYSGDKRLTLDQVQAKYAAKGLPEAWMRIRALHDHLATVLGSDPGEIDVTVEAPA